ncbi:MAG: Endo,3(4)-beta-glucanase [Candidatus Saccharibacteria bacterium]|nr:Endo,3(4)-beta-glucanase [Candidatus Saccharibacteria bacterium]
MVNRKKLGIIAGSILVISVVAVGTVALLVGKHVIKNPLAITHAPLVDQATLNTLPKKSGSSAFTDRIDKSIIPPTNSWISGMVLQKTPLPVYPMPLSFLAKDVGFEIGLPTVQSQPTVITGEHTPGIVASIDGATNFMLTRFDKFSATLTYKNGSKELAKLTIAEGSPYVFYASSTDTSLALSDISTATKDSSSTYLRYTKAGHDYVATASGGASITTSGSRATIKASNKSLVTFYALPDSSSKDGLKNFASNQLVSASTSDAAGTNDTIQTTYEYKTANLQPTVFVPMSYSSLTSNDGAISTYDSVYGPMKAVKGNTFITSVSTLKPSNALDLSRISDAHKQQLIASLPADVAKTSITANDSYYAGKQLARAATLLDIAEQLGQKKESSQLISILKDGFSTRLNGQYFYYDPTLKGIAAQTKAFGSEDFNDHHFHYGYFIYAASILGKYDADFLNNSQKKINLLVADIASYAPSSNFPVQRYYDAYAGHSWAAGLSPFADGNNQESSSEAINAWNGVALWAQLTNNTELQSSASWMLSNEAATAKAAWRTVDTSPAYLKNFTSPLTSLSFGGKRTYSTFFSDEANAKLGIQLIPMSPAMLQYATDGTSITSVINASIRNDNYNVALGDYVLMYFALAQPDKAAQLVSGQQDAYIDDGNSRTYMDAWVFSLTDTQK